MFRKIPTVVITLLSIGILVLAATLWAGRRTQSYSVLLDTTGQTSTTEFEVGVNRPDVYAVSLIYPYTDPVGRAKAWALAGGATFQGNSWQEQGAPFVFEIRINEISSGKEILNKRVAHPGLTSWGTEWLSAELVSIKLVEGAYRVLVNRSGSVVEAPPEALQLRLSEAHKGK